MYDENKAMGGNQEGASMGEEVKTGQSFQPQTPNYMPPQGAFPPPPPHNNYTYYSDGTRRYAPPVYNGYQGGYNSAPTPPKKSKAGVVLTVVGVTLLLALVCVAVFALLQSGDVRDHKKDDLDDSSVLVADQSKTEENEEKEYESVPEVVTVTPVPDESYDSLVKLYNECAPSCATIICTVEYNNGFYIQEGQALGSGFVIEGTDPETDEKAFYIITNHHVVEDAKDITVKFYDGKSYDAELIGSDEMTDIAVLSIEETNLIPLELGDSNELEVGQWVIAIGTPSGEEFAGTMSYGIISGVNREVEVTNSYGTLVKTMTVLQTTAALNSGNSGGPLINMAGQVVGINFMKFTQDYEGMGFSLPSTSAMNIINNLIAFGEVVDRQDSFVVGQGQLGISGMNVDEDVIRVYNLDEDSPHGVMVTDVSRGTAVYDAGLSLFDIITEFNGVEIDSISTLQAEIAKTNAGSEVELKFYRPGRRNEKGEYHTITFKLDYVQG